MSKQNEDIKIMEIDLFCGAGGTSTGVEKAKLNGKKCAKIIACVNHDKNAILSHAANHKNSLHFTEDIRTLDLTKLIAHTNKMKLKYPTAALVLWASLECTNFSKAKGGQPRNADSRTLAEHLFRYIEQLKPDYIQIENVEEFMGWGDMDEKGKPISKDKGKSYKKWVANVQAYGYNYEYSILNSADFGAYTSRKRFFGIFAKDGLPIVFPTPTHSKVGGKDLFGNMKQWKAVKDVLDFSDEGNSIFERKKPLSDKTLERIHAGLIKFVAGGKDAFILKYNSMSNNGKYNAPGVDEPCPVVTTQNRLGLTKVNFLSTYYGNGLNYSTNVPAPTVTTKDRFSLITTSFLVNPQYNSSGGSIDNPCFTLIARMDKMPPYLVLTKQGNICITISENDTPISIKIKEFMAIYGIAEIKMRMLKVSELKLIMGFPENYHLIGTEAEKKKFIGNAVEVNIAKAICEALCNGLRNINIPKIAA